METFKSSSQDKKKINPFPPVERLAIQLEKLELDTTAESSYARKTWSKDSVWISQYKGGFRLLQLKKALEISPVT